MSEIDLFPDDLRRQLLFKRWFKQAGVALVVMTLLLGVYPSLVTDIIGPSVEALVIDYEAALTSADTRLAEN